MGAEYRAVEVHTPGGGRARSLVLLVALVVLLVASPVVEVVEGAALVLPLLWACLIAVCAFSAASHWAERAVAAAIGVVWVAIHIWPEVLAAGVPPALSYLLIAGVFGFTIQVLLRKVLAAGHEVDGQVLADAVSVYILFGVFWANLYAALEATDPNALTLVAENADYAIVDLIYFSFTALTTVGFGDILPVSPLARILAVAEAATGVLYTTILVARLVSLYVPRSSRRGRP